jgi:hypothetical protein
MFEPDNLAVELHVQVLHLGHCFEIFGSTGPVYLKVQRLGKNSSDIRKLLAERWHLFCLQKKGIVALEDLEHSK